MTTEVSYARADDRTGVGSWIRYGVVGGAVAGIVFAVFEMFAALVIDGPAAFFMPMRMIGGMVLGPSAMDPGTGVVVAGGSGFVVHMVLSMMYGVTSAAVLSLIPALSRSTTAIVASTSAAGLGLWIVNFYVVAPLFGWTWFPNSTNPVVQFIAHVVFFGAVLGIVLDRILFRRTRTNAV